MCVCVCVFLGGGMTSAEPKEEETLHTSLKRLV